MRYGWQDFAIMGIGGVIGYFVFRGCYEESFVLWRAQKVSIQYTNKPTVITKVEEDSSMDYEHEDEKVSSESWGALGINK